MRLLWSAGRSNESSSRLLFVSPHASSPEGNVQWRLRRTCNLEWSTLWRTFQIEKSCRCAQSSHFLFFQMKTKSAKKENNTTTTTQQLLFFFVPPPNNFFLPKPSRIGFKFCTLETINVEPDTADIYCRHCFAHSVFPAPDSPLAKNKKITCLHFFFIWCRCV